VRNTEIAQEDAIARGAQGKIAAPIHKSVVARDLKNRQEQEEQRARQSAAAVRSKDEILTAAEECREVLESLLKEDETAAGQGIIVAPSEVVRDLLVQAQLAEAQLAEAVAATRPGDQKSEN
jgi:protein phosphatase 1 regulatory subunit 37